jgi:TolA-binding protein
MKAKPAGRAKPATLSEAYALELPILQPALDAVANQDYLAALAAIAAHQRKFPSGHLAEEREGLRVKALVGLGHMSEAARAGTTFCERFPHSALLGQIQEMLGTLQ